MNKAEILSLVNRLRNREDAPGEWDRLEDFADLVVREACETDPADPEDPDCIRILTRDLRCAVLYAFHNSPVQVDAPLPDATQLLDLIDKHGEARWKTGWAEGNRATASAQVADKHAARLAGTIAQAIREYVLADRRHQTPKETL